MGRRTRRTGLPNEWLGEWIGRWLNGHRPQVARLRLDTGGTDSEHPIIGTLDLPGELRFGLPVRGWWRTSSDVFGDRLTLDLAGEPATAERDDGRMLLRSGGRLSCLDPTAPFDPADLHPWMGEYAGGRCRLVVGMFAGSELGMPYAYYAEGESVVRLYPLQPGRLLSERGEIVTFRDFPRHAGRYVTFRNGHAGRCVELARSPSPIEEPVRFVVPVAPEPVGGTLLRPAGPGPHPAVICVHDGVGDGQDFYRMFAHPIVRRGLAVLIYNRPGTGTSVFDQAAQVDAAHEYLESRSDVMPDRIGLLGFGTGMWAAPMAAARRPSIAFFAGIGAPGVPMADAETYRRARILGDAGLSAGVVEQVRRTWRLIFAMAISGTATADSVAELEVLLKDLRADQELQGFGLGGNVDATAMLSPIPPAISAQELLARLSGTAEPELAHDPIADYEKVRCPVLLQYGTADRTIPIEESGTRIEHAMRTAGNPDFTCTRYPGASHLLGLLPPAEAGVDPRTARPRAAPDELNLHGFRFTPGALDELGEWLAARAFRPATSG